MVDNQHVIRYDVGGGQKLSYIGRGAMPLDNSNNPITESTKTIANRVYWITKDDVAAPIKKEWIDGKAYFSISFTVEHESAAGTGRLNFYMPSFYFFQESLTDLGDAITVDTVQGAKWSTDPKYTGGASDDYPRTRTEIARYLLDKCGLYDESTEYDGNIFLPTTEDQFPVAYENYDKLENSCTELINDVLSDSLDLIVTGKLFSSLS